MQQGHFNMIRLMGQFHNQLGYRLNAINLISLPYSAKIWRGF